MKTQKIIFETKAAFKEAYMPFVHGCGIFIPMTEPLWKLGEKVSLELTFPETTTSETISASVVWLSPSQTGFQLNALSAEQKAQIAHWIAEE